MGCYINIHDENKKKEFLNTYGQEMSFDYIFKNYKNIIKEDNYPVITIDLGSNITALAILYNKEEFLRSIKDCGINNIYYIVPLQDLIPVSNIINFIKFK